jgi:Protein of unknown function (DUF1320)
MYVAQTDLLSIIPSQFLIDAMDDDGDSVADPGVWQAISDKVDIAIDSVLAENKVVLPLSPPYPEPVLNAAQYAALDRLYLRRGVQAGEHNPWSKRARDSMESLAKWAQQGTGSTGGATPLFHGHRPKFQNHHEDGI